MVKVVDKDMGWKEAKKDLESFRGRQIKVGFMAGEGASTEVIDYATWNEFGTRRIDARPFMATTSDRFRNQTVKFVEIVAGKIIDDVYDIETGLGRIGAWYQGRMQRTIRDAKNWAVPNAESTVARKGSSSPLIDQGRMVQSVRYEVTKKE